MVISRGETEGCSWDISQLMVGMCSGYLQIRVLYLEFGCNFRFLHMPHFGREETIWAGSTQPTLASELHLQLRCRRSQSAVEPKDLKFDSNNHSMFFFCSFCQHIRRLDTSHSGIVMVTYISCNGRWFRVSTQPGKSGKKVFFLIKTWKKPGIIFGKSYKIMWSIFFRFQIQKLIVNTFFLWIIFISKCKLSKLKPFWNESGEFV